MVGVGASTFILTGADGKVVRMPSSLYQASMDGRTLLCSTESGFSVHTVGDGREQRLGEWQAGGLSQDGRQVVLFRYSELENKFEWAFFDVLVGRLSRPSRSEQRAMESLSFSDGLNWSADSRYFASIVHCTHSNANLAIWDVAAKHCVMSQGLDLGGHHAWSPVGCRLAAWTTDKYHAPTGGDWFYEGRLVLAGPPDWQLQPLTPPGVTRSAVEWSADGKYLGVVWRDPETYSVRRVFVIEAATGQRRELASGVFGDFGWSGDSRYLAVTRISLPEPWRDWDEQPVAVQVIEVLTGRPVATIEGATSFAWLDKTGRVSSWW